MVEDEDVIDSKFYNIFLGADFTGEVTFEDPQVSWYSAWECSYDIPSVAVSVWGFSQATVCAASRVLIA